MQKPATPLMPEDLTADAIPTPWPPGTKLQGTTSSRHPKYGRRR